MKIPGIPMRNAGVKVSGAVLGTQRFLMREYSIMASCLAMQASR